MIGFREGQKQSIFQVRLVQTRILSKNKVKEGRPNGAERLLSNAQNDRLLFISVGKDSDGQLAFISNIAGVLNSNCGCD